MEYRRKIRKLIMNLLGQQPFFGHILASCLWSFEKSLPAPAGMIIRDSLEIIINPETFFMLDEYDQKFTLLHEVLHFLFKHPWRAELGGRDRSWAINNIAMDLATNSYLSDSCNIKSPDWVCTPQGFNLEVNKTFEWYLKHLPTKKLKFKFKGDPGPGGGGIHGDQDQQGQGVEGEIEVEVPEHWWKTEVPEIEAEGLARRLFEGAAKMAGKVPSGALRELYEQKAEVDWRNAFINYAQSSEQNEDWRYCKRHTSRRYSVPPGAKHEYQGEIHVFVDTSGSMSPKDIGACFSIIDKLRLMGYLIWVHEVDASLHQTYIYKGVPPKVKGGGGTMFREAMQKVKEEFPEMVEAILLTDGYIFDLSGAMPEGLRSVLVVITEESRADLPDWCTVLRMRHSK